MRDYGRHVGAAFQIADDILDVVGKEEDIGKPVGSDSGLGKNTYPRLMGLEKSRELAQEHVGRALARLEPFSGDHASFLRDLAQYVVDRVC